MKKAFQFFAVCMMALLSLTSCEDTDNSRVGVSITPEVPVVMDVPHEISTGQVTPNWFAFQIKFDNPTSSRLIITGITASYRWGDETDFTAAAELEAIDDQEAYYFVSVDAGTSGLEHEYVGAGTTVWIRYIDSLAESQTRPYDRTYYVKLDFEGFFTDDAENIDPASDFPSPKSTYERTIYFRTKAPKKD